MMSKTVLEMNRSFRAQDSQMQATMRQRQQQLALRASMMKDKEEELALFLEMKKCEKERNDLLLDNSEEFDAPLGSKPGTSPIFNISTSTTAPARKTGADDFLNSENDKNDYDWLLTPPGTPLFPSLEVESQKTMKSQLNTPKARPTVLKSRLASLQPEPTTRSNLVSKQAASSLGLNTSSAGTRRPSSSGGPGSRPATPTGRPTLTMGSKPSRPSTPTSRATLPSTKPIVPATKPIVPAVKPIVPTRSSTPSRSTARPSTPTSRPWKPSEMPGFSLDAPPNLRTSVPERPLSAPRGRPGQPSSRSSSIEPGSNGRPRRQSCSPSRGRGPNGTLHASGSSVPSVGYGYSKVNDNVSPVLIGTKMVERVINTRKLAPPKLDDKQSPHSNLSGKSSSSPDGSGFGRTLSKKSLDMAIKHMDIRRSIPGNLRPLMTNIPASSMYSVRSGPAGSRAISVSDSPLATSSNGSSEVSVNNNGLCYDGIELEDDNGSDRADRSAANMLGR
ncbi:hypothetical protein I3842_02G188700 [Carya illinoinensis]|uniref:Proline-rich family protein n=1 Tax=Carya illinoinensis TaxID=32201 RepID=A0A922FUP9_CARIL|nr:hypothetical protein I3842_02G188700 [Carya illinoinensis]